MKSSECSELFALLSQYLDQELPDDICRQIDTHVSDCPPCVEFIESLKKTIGLCHYFQSENLPNPLPASARDELLTAYRKMLAARNAGEA